VQIETTEAAESALGSASFLLFKHSHRCGVSARAFAQYEQFLAAHEIDTGWINVVDDREISLWVAEHSGIEHKSPQALLIRDGEVIWHASHFKITSESLATAIRA
jgi:bacillithiol system protein YtxJ